MPGVAVRDFGLGVHADDFTESAFQDLDLPAEALVRGFGVGRFGLCGGGSDPGVAFGGAVPLVDDGVHAGGVVADRSAAEDVVAEFAEAFLVAVEKCFAGPGVPGDLGNGLDNSAGDDAFDGGFDGADPTTATNYRRALLTFGLTIAKAHGPFGKSITPQDGQTLVVCASLLDHSGVPQTVALVA